MRRPVSPHTCLLMGAVTALLYFHPGPLLSAQASPQKKPPAVSASKPALPAGGEQGTARAYEAAVRRGPLALHAFLDQFPKGADLHVHLSGAVYAETFIRDAAEDGLCIDPTGLKFVKTACTDPLVPASTRSRYAALCPARGSARMISSSPPSDGLEGSISAIRASGSTRLRAAPPLRTSSIWN